MATQPWTADLERVKRDLNQQIARLSASAQTATTRGGSDNTGLTRRVDLLERRVQETTTLLNTTVTDTRGYDARLRQLIQRETDRLTRIVDSLNTVAIHAREEVTRLGVRIDTLERRITELTRTVERTAR
jgi:polyhydroxyalkanoate synthesis regulator phasin